MMKEYQERVVAERDDLAEKVAKLAGFLSYGNSEQLLALPNDEVGRLSKQLVLMQQYLHILNDRILHFQFDVIDSEGRMSGCFTQGKA